MQVPTPLTPNRRRFLAIKWLLSAARDKPGPRNAKMDEKLCQEILSAYNDEVKYNTLLQRNAVLLFFVLFFRVPSFKENVTFTNLLKVTEHLQTFDGGDTMVISV